MELPVGCLAEIFWEGAWLRRGFWARHSAVALRAMAGQVRRRVLGWGGASPSALRYGGASPPSLGFGGTSPPSLRYV